eukprot:Stramenopile-MAST_4_protein_2532
MDLIASVLNAGESDPFQPLCFQVIAEKERSAVEVKGEFCIKMGRDTYVKRIEDGVKLWKHFGIDGGGLFWWVNQAASPVAKKKRKKRPVANKANMNKTNKANGPCRNLWRTTRTGMSY